MKKVLYLMCITLFIVSCGMNHKIGKEVAEEDSVTLDITDSILMEQMQESQISPGFEGLYFCNRTHDTYEFREDGTGEFNIQGGVEPSEYTWKRNGSKIVITYTGKYASSGKCKLDYNEEKQTITENTKDFGKLTFNKEK